MGAELERLARVAVGHGLDDPTIDVFLAFVGALDPLPDAGTLKPAAMRIGKLRLARALDRPGEPRLGACRLLAAACAEPLRPAAPPPAGPAHEPVGYAPERIEDVVRSPGSRARGALTVERPVDTGRGLPEMVEGLLHAIRAGLSLFASR